MNIDFALDPDEPYVPIAVPPEYVDARLLVFRVKGDCMLPDIADGDRVVVALDEPPQVGEIGAIIQRRGAAFADNAAMTLKRVAAKGARWRLVPDNPAYSSLSAAAADIVAAYRVIAIVRPARPMARRLRGAAMSACLDHLADRVSNDPAFVASAVTAERLMAVTGCDALTATKIRLCRAPSRSGEDVRLIAARFGVVPLRLGAALASE